MEKYKGRGYWVPLYCALSLAVLLAQSNVPYSCRLLYDEQRKCAFGSCDKRVIERLTKQCLQDGGRP